MGVGLTVRASADSASSPPGQLAIASLLVQKEEELRAITAPGRLAPKAAVVAAIRKDIAALREQLKSSVTAKLPPTLASDLLPQTKPTPKPAPTVSSPAMSTSPAPRASGARGALLLVEQQLSVGSPSAPGSNGTVSAAQRVRSALQAVEQNLSMGALAAMGDLAEYEALQQENAVLQSQLEALVAYKRQLLELKRRVNSGSLAGVGTANASEGAAGGEGPAEAPKKAARRSSKSVDGDDATKPKTTRRRTTTKEKVADGTESPRKRVSRKAKTEGEGAKEPEKAALLSAVAVVA